MAYGNQKADEPGIEIEQNYDVDTPKDENTENSDQAPGEDITDTSNEPAVTEEPEDFAEPKGPNIFKRFWGKYTANKKVTVPVTIAFILAVLLGVPVTRYLILGTVIKRDVRISVIDSKTNIAVSEAEISVQGKNVKTDGEGKATVKGIKVGKANITASKKYYKDSSVTFTVPLGQSKAPTEVKLEATGRQVPIHVINKITGKNVAGASIKVSDTEAQTDQNGEATLVLPVDQHEVTATVAAKGFNNLPVKVIVDQLAVKANTFPVTPSGKVYFLSKLTGKIDVVKTDLDGSNRQTVLAGTGKEEDGGTVLLATRDWKYLALQSRREGDKARLYLIDTSSDKLTEIDSGDATFTPVGWHDHFFIYKVARNNIQAWQPINTALKTFNAATAQLVTIDETAGEGSSNNDYANEAIDNVYVANNNVIYVKRWQASYYSLYKLANRRTGIYTVKPNGSNKQLLKDFDASANTYISAVASEPGEIYYSVNNSTTNTSYYTYLNGKISEDKEVKADDFTKFYPTYLLSPSGQNTFWHEPRDGKNTLFIGAPDGDNGKEIATLSEYIPYGWYSDDYLLVSKEGSELYILPKDGSGNKGVNLKISDYHKPNVTFQGYGGGYGGF